MTTVVMNIMLGQAMMAMPFFLAFFFSAAFSFAMIILIAGGWIAKLAGFIKGDEPNLERVFVKISIGLGALLIMLFINY